MHDRLTPWSSRRAWLASALWLAATGLSPAARAAGYPDKPIRIVITTTAEGQADVMARALAAKLTEKFVMQTLVDAKPGANGIIATDFVAKSPPDGYTLLMATGSHAINPAVYPKLPFDPKRDFAPVAQVVPPGPLVLIAHPSLAANNVAELLALARARPDTITYASAGVGNTTHLGGEMLQQLGGVKLTHVPYKGMSQAVNDVLGGQVQFMFNPWPASEAFVKEGKLKVLAQTGAARMATGTHRHTGRRGRQAQRGRGRSHGCRRHQGEARQPGQRSVAAPEAGGGVGLHRERNHADGRRGQGGRHRPRHAEMNHPNPSPAALLRRQPMHPPEP